MDFYRGSPNGGGACVNLPSSPDRNITRDCDANICHTRMDWERVPHAKSAN